MLAESSLSTIFSQLNTGVLVLDLDGYIVNWNRFLATHANKAIEEVVEKSVYDVFPELPRKWFERKLRGVIQLKSPFFCSWEQRHHLFELPHNRPITTDSYFMAQNCTFLPIEENNEVVKICILIEDATDVCYFQSRLQDTMLELELATRIDGLTQIYNRKYWQESLVVEFARAKRHNNNLSLIMFDLDHFKKLNDTHGHQCGDLVLIETARHIKKFLRSADVFGRYGGEEFAIILPETNLVGAAEVAERIRQSISSFPVMFDGKEIKFSVSIGLAMVTQECQSSEVLVSEADSALYRAKTAGRNQICISRPLEKCS